MTENPDLASLVTRARDGDREAWAAIVDQFARLVYAVCRGYRLSPSDSGDVSQTVWLRLTENIHRIENPARLGAWLVTTTRRECLAHLKARSRFDPLTIEFESKPSGDPAPEATVTRRETITEVATAFALLSLRCQELLRRTIMDPRTYQQVSAELNVPVGSIGPTRARCLEQLRQHLQEAIDVR